MPCIVPLENVKNPCNADRHSRPGRNPRKCRSGRLPSLLMAVYSALCAYTPLQAAILPTEIFYNGPSPGADPDEFLELSNTGSSALSLQDFRFSLGIDLQLPDITLEPLASLIIAPNPAGFRASFPDFSGALLDARGGLSNSGETIELLDAGGDTIFRLSYDDTGAWPRSADGAGDSLQLLDQSVSLSDAMSWFAAMPDPGTWTGFAVPDDPQPDPGTTIPVPGTLALMLASLAGWAGTRTRQSGRNTSGPNYR
ncbi:MAG: lamin tail domain-containing protein [Pseudomonadota bacterium]